MNIIHKILSNPNGKQIIALYISTIGGVLLGVLSSVINTRFLDPVNYGDVRYVQNLINLFSCIFLLGFFVSGSRLLAISKSKAEANGIKGVMVIFLIITIAALMFMVLLCYFYHLLFQANMNAVLFLFSIPVCAQPLLLNYINTTAQGDNQVGRIAYARLLPALLYVIAAYFIYSRYGASSALMILLQWGIACMILVAIVISTHPDFKEYKKYKRLLIEENRKYGLYLYIGSLAMVATQYLPGVTLGFFNTDNRDVALFTLALTISMPLSMLPSIVGTSYFKKFATQQRINNKVFMSTIIITLLSFLAYVAIIQPIVDFLYPVSYSQIGVYASLLAVSRCIYGIGDMVNRFLGAHGLGKEIRNASFATGFCMIIGSIVGVYFFNVWGAIATNIVGSVTYFIVLFYYYRKFVR